ncbi:MAG: ribonuclease III [Deltaproteobacteria bacterium]|nr:ribonuclease III [Deltaproteobacteria bacterium]
MSKDRKDPIDRLAEALGHTFADQSLLKVALTHRSYVNEASGVDNERLEFLGDAVIDLVVSGELMRRQPEAREGSLSRMRAAVVNEAGLARVAERAGIGEALRLGRGEEASGGRERPSILADAFEAVIAAVFLDAGFDRAREVLLALIDFPDESERPRGDPKTELQEKIQARIHRPPTYRVVEETGPDHQKEFTVEIVLGERVLARGSGRTKKEAEQRAAKVCIEDLDVLLATIEPEGEA